MFYYFTVQCNQLIIIKTNNWLLTCDSLCFLLRQQPNVNFVGNKFSTFFFFFDQNEMITKLKKNHSQGLRRWPSLLAFSSTSKCDSNVCQRWDPIRTHFVPGRKWRFRNFSLWYGDCCGVSDTNMKSRIVPQQFPFSVGSRCCREPLPRIKVVTGSRSLESHGKRRESPSSASRQQINCAHISLQQRM